MSGSLKGLSVLVTRPQPQAEKLARHLASYGADSTVLPMVEIKPLLTPGAPLNALSDLSQFDKAIVISIPAADITLSLDLNHLNSMDWFTPGRSTARTLASAGISATCPNNDFTSEALLTLPPLQNVHGQRILLLKGEGGRDLLERELTKRGAKVVPEFLYQRVCPKYPAGTLVQIVASKGINAIVATSSQIVTSLRSTIDLERYESQLDDIPLLVPSPRVAVHATESGFNRVITCAGASNQHIVDALQELVEQEPAI